MTHQQTEAVFEFLKSVEKLFLSRRYGFSCEKILYETNTQQTLKHWSCEQKEPGFHVHCVQDDAGYVSIQYTGRITADGLVTQHWCPADNSPHLLIRAHYALYRAFSSAVFQSFAWYFIKRSALSFPSGRLIPSALFFWLFFFFLLLWSRIIWASADCCSFPMNASISSKQWLSKS